MVGGSLSQIVRCLLLGSLMSIGGKKMLSFTAKATKADMEYVLKLVEEGRVKPVIDRRYPLHETAEAIRYIGEGHARGKVIVDMSVEG